MLNSVVNITRKKLFMYRRCLGNNRLTPLSANNATRLLKFLTVSTNALNIAREPVKKNIGELKPKAKKSSERQRKR